MQTVLVLKFKRCSPILKNHLFWLVLAFFMDHGSPVLAEGNDGGRDSAAFFRTTYASQPVINEVMASNVLTVPDEQGDYDDWLEIYNPGPGNVNIGGFYFSDDTADLQKWRVPANQPSKTTVPAHGYLIVWTDGQPDQGTLHAAFRLSRMGGIVLFIAADGRSVLDSLLYPQQVSDVSFGCFPDGSPQFGFSPLPTPGFANSQNFQGFALPPEIMTESGFATSPISVAIEPVLPSDSVSFTMDGSDPTGTSSLYLNPIPIAHTTVLRARTIHHGLAPSDIVSKIFFINTNPSLPVMSIVTDPVNLFDEEKGIYANPDESGRAWERKITADCFFDKTLRFSFAAGLRIQGNTGRTMEKKSFRFHFREGYGQDVLDADLFDPTTVNRFKNLVLRAGYDDDLTQPSGTLLRDPLINELWRKLGNPASHGQFVVLYLNDNPWGIYEIREDVNDDFVRNYFRYDNIDMIRLRWPEAKWPLGWELEHGEAEGWLDFQAFINTHSFVSDSMFAEAAERLDIENFTDMMALAHATQYRSWNYGAFAFKEKREGARWQWTIWDMDRAYDDLDWNEFSPPSGYSFWVNTIAPKLLENTSYRRTFINRLSDLLNTVFLPEHVLPVLDSLASIIEPEIPAEVRRWGSSTEAWHTNVENARRFISQRPVIVRQQMQDYFHLNGQAALTVRIDGGNGKITVNSVTISRFPWTGKYFTGIPIVVTAVPDSGYRFEGWSDPLLPEDESLTLNLSGDRTIGAVFSPLGSAAAELIAPKRIKSGQRLPIVVRLRDADGNIDPVEQTPMDVQFAGAHADTSIRIKRGAGTGVVEVQSDSVFTLCVQNTHVPPTQKRIQISTIPTISYSGTLPVGDVVWDSTADRLVESDITIPAGCHLTIRQGTWVMVKKHVNFHVQGRMTVTGSSDEPAVITSDIWPEPWGGMEFTNAKASFRYCMVLNGGGDLSKGHPTDEDWHTGHQHVFFGKDNSEFVFDQCFFLNSPGKVFGAQDSKVTVTNSVTSFVWHGGEFHRVLLSYRDSHLMNLPNDDPIYTEDIDTDGFHIDWVYAGDPSYSVIDRCYFVTGKDDAIDHHASRLRISNCWLEDFIHEGVAASGGDTVRIFNTVALGNDQGFEAGWTEGGVTQGPVVFVDHCVAVQNHVGLRIGDSYAWSYRDFMKVTNSVIAGNEDNIRNFLNSTHAPLEGALEISYSMTNDSDYDNSPQCITGVPQFDERYRLLPGSAGAGNGIGGTNLGLIDTTAIMAGPVVINEIMYHEPEDWPTGDWVELFNPQAYPQDISGWIMHDQSNEGGFRMPSGTVLPDLGFLVVCRDSSAFRNINPTITGLVGNLDFGLGRGDEVRLFSAIGEQVDTVAYGTTGPWPSAADGGGSSLALIDPSLDNSLPASWRASLAYGGTPGRANDLSDVAPTAPTHAFRTFCLGQNYPNPFNPSTRIQYFLPKAVHVTLKVFDLLGREIATLVDENQDPGEHEVLWQAVDLPTGILLCRLEAGDFIAVKKLIHQK